LVMMERLPGTQALRVGGDKGFDTLRFVEECRNLRVTPHVAQNLDRWPYHAALELRPQPEEEEADRGMLRLAEDCRADAEGPTSRSEQSGLDIYPGLRLESGAHAQPGRRRYDGVSPGRGVSRGA
jgi:hypothetical protein